LIFVITIDRPWRGLPTKVTEQGLTHEHWGSQHLLQDGLLDNYSLSGIDFLLLWWLVAGLNRVFREELTIARFHRVDDAPEKLFVGDLALRQLTGEVFHQLSVILYGGPKLVDRQLRPSRQVEGGNLVAKQVLLLPRCQLLQIQEWALFFVRKVSID